jgi:hypothetical protein
MIHEKEVYRCYPGSRMINIYIIYIIYFIKTCTHCSHSYKNV